MSKKKEKKQKAEEANAEDDEMKPGAIYLSHIPHGFYEREMKSYFSQFGEVTNLKLIRSKRTGRSRGFAFIEFATSIAAKDAAETNNNYLLFEKVMKCRYIDPASLKPNTFRRFTLKKRVKTVKKPKTQTEIQGYVKGVLERENKRRDRLKSLGIEYEFPGYSSCIETKEYKLETPKHTVFTDEDEQ